MLSMTSSVIIRKPESLDQYMIDPVLKRYFRKFLEGRQFPGAPDPRRELEVIKLKPGFHSGGLELEVGESEYSGVNTHYWVRPDSSSEFHSHGFHGDSPWEDSDYVFNLLTHTIRGKRMPETGKETIKVETGIGERSAPRTPERRGKLDDPFWIKEPYSADDDSVIHYILEHFKLTRSYEHPNFIVDYGNSPYGQSGFRPHSLRRLDDSFERLYLARDIIDNFLWRHKAIAEAAIAEGLKKHRKK